MKATSIAWTANQFGYTVRVLRSGITIADYNAGNCKQDSTATVPPGDPVAVPVKTLRKYARATAREMAQEYRVPIAMIEEDEDLLDAQEQAA